MASYRLLLADDSLTIQKVVELVLGDDDFEIKAVNDGEQALEALGSFSPHIVLADIEMPKLNGYQLCEKIKNSAATVHLPVILLTGAFEPFDEEYAKSVGADDFIVKPFESQELISKVKSLLVGMEAGGATAPVATVAVQEITESFSLEEPERETEMPVAIEDNDAFKSMTEEEYDAKAALASFSTGFEDDLKNALKTEETEAPVVGFSASVDSIELPSRNDIREIVRQSVDRRVSDILGNDIVPELAASVRETVSATLTQNAPKIIEDVTRELVNEMMQSLHDEISAAINRIVPDVAETIIKKEIKKITAQP